jgi:hypothetical protein
LFIFISNFMLLLQLPFVLYRFHFHAAYLAFSSYFLEHKPSVCLILCSLNKIKYGPICLKFLLGNSGDPRECLSLVLRS